MLPGNIGLKNNCVPKNCFVLNLFGLTKEGNEDERIEREK